MSAAAIFVDFRSMVSTGSRVLFIFDSSETASSACILLADAAKAYHDRNNYRQRMVSFETASGPATVDVSDIAAIGVEDPTGRGKAAMEAWSVACGRLNGLARAALASGIAAGTDETLKAAQPEGQEPGPQGDATNSSPEPLTERWD